MNKRITEEDLIQVAFGDAVANEREIVGETIQGDPRLEARLRAYTELSQGLKKLPVPEHQMSTERLRDAILKEGLKGKKSAPQWRLAWIPLAVGALSFLAMRQVNVGSGGAVAKLDQGFGAPSILAPAGGSDFASEPVAESRLRIREPAAPGLSFEPEPQLSAIERVGERKFVASRGAATNRKEVQRDDSALAELEAAVFDAVAESSAPVARPASLIIIEEERDEGTGAKRATEVSTTANVVVGG